MGLEMMKVPTGDHEIYEDEYEGLVSSSVGGGGPGKSLSSTTSSTWISSKNIGKQKKVLGVLACIVIALALVGLNKSDGPAILGGTDVTSSQDKPTEDYFDDAFTFPENKTKVGGDDDDAESGVATGSLEDKKVTNNDSSDKNGDQVDKEDGGSDVDAEKDNSGDKIKSTDSDADSSEVKVDEPEQNDTNGDTDTEDNSTTSSSSNENSDPSVAKEPSKYQFPKEQYTTDNIPWTRPISDEEKEAIAEKWGKWHFWDGDPDSRPTEDYLAPFPNRDCPLDDFPATAWQADAVYVNHMLDSAGELVSRAKEAIYTEYGYGPRDELDHDQLKKRMEMFKLSLVELDDDSAGAPPESLTQGGWTTRRTLDAFARRLLHAMMTNDSFTIVVGGHSAAAGHGNNFLQNYAMQMYKVLKPVFDRVGVELIVRNECQGGLGTLQHSLGSADIYGDNIDVLVWDSSMTEKDQNAIDLFYRQALIGGKRAPILWGGPLNLLKNLYSEADGKSSHFPTFSEMFLVDLTILRFSRCDDARKWDVWYPFNYG